MKRVTCFGFLISVLLAGAGQNSLAQCLMNCSFKGTTTVEDLIVTKTPWIDVRTYGAKGDGGSDDTAAIQRAISAGSSSHSIVMFPQGTYKITSRLKVGPNVTLQGTGVGWGTQILPISTDAITLIGADFPQNNNSTFQNRIKEMMINMNLNPGHTAINVNGAYTVKIEDVAVNYGKASASGNAVTITGSTNVVLSNVRIEGVGNGTGNGITIDNSEVKIYNVDIERFFNGITINHANGTVHIFGGYLESMGGYGILFTNSSFNTVEGIDYTAPNGGSIPIGFLGSLGSPSEQNTIIGSTLNFANKPAGASIFQDENSKDNMVINSSMVNGSIVTKGNNHLTVIKHGIQVGEIRIGGGNSIAKHLSQTAHLKFPAPHKVPGNIDLVIALAGVDFGDTVTVGSPVSVGENYILTAFVSAPNKVTIRWTQIAGSPEPPDGAGGIYRADVWKHD
ncbi:MAG: glycosyl hydrolase family 28-related protein [Nitrospiria bacterium]